MRLPSWLLIVTVFATWTVAARTADAAAGDVVVSPERVALASMPEHDGMPDEGPSVSGTEDEVDTAAVASEFSKTAESQTSTALPLECRRFKATRFSASDLFGHSLQLQHVRLQV